jgi:DnaK suppressor protein
MLKAKDHDQFRQLLQVLEARLAGDVETLSSGALGGSADTKSPTHMAELGTETYEQDFSLRIMESDQETLNEVRAALKRIKDGTYGVCEGCVEQGKPPSKCWIPKTRLKVIPYARYCVACAEKMEGQYSY